MLIREVMVATEQSKGEEEEEPARGLSRRGTEERKGFKGCTRCAVTCLLWLLIKD